MFVQEIRAQHQWPAHRVALGLAGAAILAGLYAAPTTVVLAAAALPVVAVLAFVGWRWPELLIVGLAFFNSGLFMRESLALSLPVGRLDGADLSLLGLLVVALIRGVQRRQLLMRWWPVSGLLLLYFGVALFSTAYALLCQGVSANLVLGELRAPLYCVGCVLAAPLLTERRQFARLLIGLFVVADLTATVVLLQNLLGAENRLLAGMSDGSWQVNEQHTASSAFGAVRIVPPGHVLLYLMSIVAFCLLVGRDRRWWERAFLAAQIGVLNLGLLLTYTRAQWIASALAMGLALLLMPREQKARVGRYLLALAPCALIAIVAIAPYASSDHPMLEALGERFTSILAPGETLNSASLEWREFEMASATAAIAAQPLVGVGLGNDYRPVSLLQMENRGWLWRLDGDGRLTRFVHNSYLYVGAKMGLPGLGTLLLFAAALLVSSARTYRRAAPGLGRTLLLPIACSFAGLLEWSFFEAHLMLAPSMATVGTMVAIAGAALALDAAGARGAPARIARPHRRARVGDALA
jgi:O-antigen ligase